MEDKTEHLQAGKVFPARSNRARTDMKRDDNKTTAYWGILCRNCQDLIAFDIRPHASFGPGVAGTKPGTIRCGCSHSNIYFPRDFQFISSTGSVTDAVMQENRRAYTAITPSSHLSHSDVRSPAEKAEALRREVEIFGDGDDLPADEWKIVWESYLSHEAIMVRLNALRSEKRTQHQPHQ